jgi:ABC-type amino acid transport system permease subunit
VALFFVILVLILAQIQRYFEQKWKVAR